ncbi:MAG: DUF5686 and carboxypeptidase regulatory-like domain-containing protein [Bacteroidetes bacterium]|nr:DUF5686 and carboxypeptidase regulatory-like domain-containing protein [Bacteroidota bacterium]
MKYYNFLLTLFSVLWIGNVAFAQTEVKGRVTDALTKEPLPFANVLFSGTTVGVTSDFDGYFLLSSPQHFDSITVSYIGYKKYSRAIRPGQKQVVEIQLQEDAENLREVVITPGRKKIVNPAHAIIKHALDHKSSNNKTSLTAYEYEAYNKIELNLQRLPERATNRKIMQQVQAAYDSIHQYTTEEGEALLPIFLSESISRYYYRTKPQLYREHMLHTNLKGFGVEDGSFLSQLVGSSFQEYNFYENWLTILEKEFVSPLADGWKLYYDYALQDSLLLDGALTYKIGVSPKREQDLAFYGTIWITKEGWALKQLDLQVLPKANLNFVHKIAISQLLSQTAAGPWLPEKTRVMMDVRNPGQKGGIVAKFYTSLKEPLVNQPRDPAYYANPLTVEAKATQSSDAFWSTHRHDSLSYEEQKVAQMIDSANNIPAVRRSVTLLKVLATGYVKITPALEAGPFPLFYTFNDVEGHRLGFGMRTTTAFSSRYRFTGAAAYGTKDNRFKYKLEAQRLLSRTNWTMARAFHQNDLEQVGLEADKMDGSNYFFYASSRWGSLQLPYRYQHSGLQLQTDVARGATVGISVNHRYFTPLYPFSYRQSYDTQRLASSFTTTEVQLETRLAKGEAFLINDFDRISSGIQHWPVISLRYAYGIPNFLGSDFEYHRLGLHATQRVKMAFLGVSRYTLEGGKYFGTLPYPLLRVHLGNPGFFYTSAAYNLMDLAEFASDTYASLRYIHYFEGFLLNRIPLLRRLKWRAIAHSSILWGQLSEKNQDIVTPLSDAAAADHRLPRSLGNTPYIEVGYGIENIFKFFRVDAFHRLTHLDSPNARRFGVKISMAMVL